MLSQKAQKKNRSTHNRYCKGAGKFVRPRRLVSLNRGHVFAGTAEWVLFLHIYQIFGFVPLEFANVFVPFNNWDGSIIDFGQCISKGLSTLEFYLEAMKLFDAFLVLLHKGNRHQNSRAYSSSSQDSQELGGIGSQRRHRH
jgi:hypothetical protein